MPLVEPFSLIAVLCGGVEEDLLAMICEAIELFIEGDAGIGMAALLVWLLPCLVVTFDCSCFLLAALYFTLTTPLWDLDLVGEVNSDAIISSTEFIDY